jgi:hypothetical protein
MMLESALKIFQIPVMKLKRIYTSYSQTGNQIRLTMWEHKLN